VEYVRKEERKDCLVRRAEMRGTRRAEVRKERVMGFMMTEKRGRMGNRQVRIKWGRYILRLASLRNTEDTTAMTAYAASPAAITPRLAIGGPTVFYTHLG
jgi:hypothetical protein